MALVWFETEVQKDGSSILHAQTRHGFPIRVYATDSLLKQFNLEIIRSVVNEKFQKTEYSSNGDFALIKLRRHDFIYNK